MDSNPAQTEELYRAAVGENKADYYLPLFYRFDQGGSRVSWNWPAFFVAFFWMLYRRMYGLAFAILLLLPLAQLMVVGVVSAALGSEAGGLAYIVVILVQIIGVPMFANALYHWQVRKRIDKMAAHAPSHEALVQRLIGQSTGNAPLIVGIACFGGIAVIGILAAIAIPAYQDYTIRAQVSEGLNLAASVKASVAEVYAASGSWPEDLSSAGLDSAAYSGNYVSDIEVSDGVVLIHYGNAANKLIAGGTLSLHPAAGRDGDIQWTCGYAADDDGMDTDIPPKYLPSSCRGTAPQVERL
jgi:Tfp pilus assembly major pilin PilA